MKVFYRPEQSARTESFSPSSSKPAAAVADWLERGLITDADIIEDFSPATRAQLYAAHDRAFVDGVLEGGILNGFGNTHAAIAESLPYTSGSMIAAAIHAARERETACSPTSGFHHAGWMRSEGFCTFNGLIVAAQAVRNSGYADRIAIVDCDQHYGNGTDEIIDRLGSKHIKHLTMGKVFADQSDFQFDECEYTDHLHDWLGRNLGGVDLVLYQAGADPHINDPLGGLLSTERMRIRDEVVFLACKQASVPVAWNLAGGYQRDKRGSIEPVLALHRNTIKACREVERGNIDGAYSYHTGTICR